MRFRIEGLGLIFTSILLTNGSLAAQVGLDKKYLIPVISGISFLCYFRMLKELA